MGPRCDVGHLCQIRSGTTLGVGVRTGTVTFAGPEACLGDGTILASAVCVEAGDVHIIMDNYATHKTPLIWAWFAKRPRFHVHFTPTYASWLNLIERWFAELTTKQLRRGVHRSVRALETAIDEFIAAHNASGAPFVWTKTADEILANIARFARRTLNLTQAPELMSRTIGTGH